MVDLTYLLGIVDAGRDVSAIGDRPLWLAGDDRVAAVYTSLPAAELPGEVDDPLDEAGPLARLARWHDDTVRALAVDGPVLPIRLGSVAADAGALQRAIAARSGELAADLDRVRGRAEWTVRTIPLRRVEAPDDEPTGTAYLLARRTESRLRATTSALLDEAYEAIASAAERSVPGSYLVTAARERDFLATVSRYDERLQPGGYALRVLGPLPPYSFVDVRLTGDDDA